MKHKLICALMSLLIVVLAFSAFLPASYASPTEVAVKGTEQFSKEKVLEAHFLSMLNRNYVYDDAFNTVDAVVNNSVTALLDKRDSSDGSFIAENYVKDFIYSMYGVEIDGISSVNENTPYREGYIYIIPRGFTVYSHKISSVCLNEDGSYTVTSKVTVTNHDAPAVTATAVTLFVKNDSSDFGYNIISSDILEEASAM